MSAEPIKPLSKDDLKLLKPEKPDPWLAIKEYLPPGYAIDPHGVALLKETKGEDGATRVEKIYFAGPVWVSALTRQPDQVNYGSLVEWVNIDGVEKQQAVPHKAFHDPKSTIAQDLADQGLRIVPGRQKDLVRYLEAFSTTIRRRNQSVGQIGWIDDVDGKLSYVLPTQTISPDTSPEKIVFQPERYSPSSSTIFSAGTLNEWKERVCLPLADEPYMLFSLFVAFAGPLLKYSDIDSGGFHFFQRTSRGKTTALQVAGSVWGCGADPSIAPSKAFIQRWNTAPNALEAIAAAHNDMLLAIDEIGTCDAKDFGKLIYDLFGGTGKSRLNSASQLKESRTWRNLVLSTGEVSIEQKLEGQGAPKGGQKIRFCDIPIDDSLIIKKCDQRDFVDSIKTACSNCFGTAGPAFIEAIVSEYDSAQLLRESVRAELERAFSRLIPEGQDRETMRLGKRLALVEAAGRLAKNLLLLPITDDQITFAMDFVCSAWLESPGGINDGERVISSLRNFILANKDRFANGDKEDGRRNGPLAGYYTDYRKGTEFVEKLWLFTSKQLSEACGGVDPKLAAKVLADAGLIHSNEGRGTFKCRLEVLGDKERGRFYAIKDSILD